MPPLWSGRHMQDGPGVYLPWDPCSVLPLRPGMSLAVQSRLALQLATPGREGIGHCTRCIPKRVTQRFRAQTWQSDSNGFENWLQHLPAGWPWASLLSFLSHSCLIFKKEGIVAVQWRALCIPSFSPLPVEYQFCSGIPSYDLWGGGPSSWSRSERVISSGQSDEREYFCGWFWERFSFPDKRRWQD